MLTDKQEAFAKGIAEGMNQSDAYRAAYNTSRMKDKSIWDAASKLAGNTEVIQRVRELRDMSASPTIMTAQRRKEWLTEVINDPGMDINAKLKALDQLNKMDGEYIQKVQAEVHQDITINVELVDDDED